MGTMSPHPSWSFLLSYGWQDIRDRRDRWTGRVIVITITAVTVLALLSFGVPRAAEQAKQEQMGRRPDARYLWVRPEGGLAVDTFTPTRLQQLRVAVDNRMTPGRTSAVVYPFHDVVFAWGRAESESPTYEPGIRGRTIAPGDPLLHGYAESGYFVTGGPFESPEQPGVIVTAELLQKLGYPANNPAGTTTLEVASPGAGIPLQVPLVGVVWEKFPLGHQFIFNEAFEQSLHLADPDIPARRVRIGPVPRTWPDPLFLPSDISAKLDDLRIQTPPILQPIPEGGSLDTDPLCWVLTTTLPTSTPTADLPRMSYWSDDAKRIAEWVEDAGYPPSPGFGVLPDSTRKPTPPSRPGYDRAAVLTSDDGSLIEGLRAASAGIKDAGMETDDRMIRVLEAYSEAAQAAEFVLQIVVFVVGLVALVNLGALQGLRAGRKSTEIGLLKAVGMSSQSVRFIFVIEAGFLWLIGTIIGLLITIISVYLLGLVMISENFSALISVGWIVYGLLFLVGSLFGTTMTAWFATSSARRHPPAKIMSG